MTFLSYYTKKDNRFVVRSYFTHINDVKIAVEDENYTMYVSKDVLKECYNQIKFRMNRK